MATPARKRAPSMDRLSCIQLLQNMEARYTNEAIGWTVMLLTLIMLGLGLVEPMHRIVYGPLKLSWQIIIIGMIYAVIALAIYYTVIGLLSSYLASKITTTIINDNDSVFRRAEWHMCNKLQNRIYYCLVAGKDKMKKSKTKNNLNKINKIIETPTALCVSNEIIEASKNRVVVAPPRITSSWLVRVIQSSGIIVEDKLDHIGAYSTMMLFFIILLMYKIDSLYSFLNILLVAILAEILLLAVYLFLGKCPIDNDFYKVLEDKYISVNEEGAGEKTKLLSNLNQLICELGLDKASRCCAKGRLEYCMISSNIVRASRSFGIIVSSYVYALLLWLTFQ